MTVSVPAFIAVQVTVTAPSAETVVVRTPVPHRLLLIPGKPASVLIPGQRVGRYPIAVDGTVRGALVIGGDAGP